MSKKKSTKTLTAFEKLQEYALLEGPSWGLKGTGNAVGIK